MTAKAHSVRARVLWMALVAVLVPDAGWAQTPFRHSGGESKHGSYSPFPNEHVDPASGSLSLVATDLVLPGNAGFDLRVTRIYSSNIYPDYDTGSTEIAEDSWAGIGWRLHFGRVLNPTPPWAAPPSWSSGTEAGSPYTRPRPILKAGSPQDSGATTVPAIA